MRLRSCCAPRRGRHFPLQPALQAADRSGPRPGVCLHRHPVCHCYQPNPLISSRVLQSDMLPVHGRAIMFATSPPLDPLSKEPDTIPVRRSSLQPGLIGVCLHPCHVRHRCQALRRRGRGRLNCLRTAAVPLQALLPSVKGGCCRLCTGNPSTKK